MGKLRPERPTLAQKKAISRARLLPDNWMVLDGKREEAYEEGVLACKSAISRYNPNPKHREVCTQAKQFWIPITERLPETGDYILISSDNFSLPDIGRYEVDEDGGGAFYPGDEDESYNSFGAYVNAWMPLPQPWKGE